MGLPSFSTNGASPTIGRFAHFRGRVQRIARRVSASRPFAPPFEQNRTAQTSCTLGARRNKRASPRRASRRPAASHARSRLRTASSLACVRQDGRIPVAAASPGRDSEHSGAAASAVLRRRPGSVYSRARAAPALYLCTPSVRGHGKCCVRMRARTRRRTASYPLAWRIQGGNRPPRRRVLHALSDNSRDSMGTTKRRNRAPFGRCMQPARSGS
ncbi:hypothetical protein C2E23DRAFT_521699 [Lenzites betulinus]|nr:hypothetical protein C2E23DRAFT_521699 [Lenzites betulinus]